MKAPGISVRWHICRVIFRRGPIRIIRAYIGTNYRGLLLCGFESREITAINERDRRKRQNNADPRTDISK